MVYLFAGSKGLVKLQLAYDIPEIRLGELQ